MGWGTLPEGTKKEEQALKEAREAYDHACRLLNGVQSELIKFKNEAIEREESTIQTCLSALCFSSFFINSIIFAGFKDKRLRSEAVRLMSERFPGLLEKGLAWMDAAEAEGKL